VNRDPNAAGGETPCKLVNYPEITKRVLWKESLLRNNAAAGN
jgi:hypothetical protein